MCKEALLSVWGSIRQKKSGSSAMGHKPRHRRNRKKVNADISGSSSAGSASSSTPPDDPSPLSEQRFSVQDIPAQSGCQHSKMSAPEMREFRISKSYHSGANTSRLNQGDPTWDSIERFVDHHVENVDKRRYIKKILISTNGIAAVKCMNSMRKLLMHQYGTDKYLKFICMTTEQEIQSNAEYLKLTNGYVIAPTGDNKNNYANVDEIVTHAVEQNVDAVWAGWGHASENPDLPHKLAEKGISFIGPPRDAMFSLGDKIASTIIAQSVDIPTIEWSGSGLKIDVNALSGGVVTVSQELFNKACVFDANEGLAAVEKYKIGYPLMIKASEGGGGKGIRKVPSEKDFRSSFAAVLVEVPGSPIFIMKCVENARHIEVQLIADRYGNVIPVYTRDCSIQRRCQKIIEEAPASIAPEEILRSMQMDAVRIAQLVNYESAGTVEYMYLPDENRYFFLELNPRLQVEHPCTEMIASINIPGIQLQIAMGLPLDRIVDIRYFYGFRERELYEKSPLPSDLVKTRVDHHCVAARITSENPEDYFRPSTGSVKHLDFKSSQDVWGYFSISSSGKVHEFADSQFGHLFAIGRNRQEAISKMRCALQELTVQATFASQISYLGDILNDKDFVDNKFNTQWLDNRIAKNVKVSTCEMHELIAVSSAVIGHARISAAFNTFRSSLERGQIVPTKDLTETIEFDLVKEMSIYKVKVTRSGPITYFVSLNGGKTKLEVRQLGDGCGGDVIVTYRGQKKTCSMEETADQFRVTIDHKIAVFEKDNDPTILKSPYTGKLLSYKKANGEYIKTGEVYASIESMKLVFDVEVKKAPGRLEHVLREGDPLYPGTVIGRIEQANVEAFRPRPFVEPFPEWVESEVEDTNFSELRRFNNCYDACMNILNGSIPPDSDYKPESLINELFGFVKLETLGHSMLRSIVNGPALKRDAEFASFARKIEEIAKSDSIEVFGKIKEIVSEFLETVSSDNWEKAKLTYGPLYDTCEKFLQGVDSHMASVVNGLLNQYNTCEKYFEGRVYDDAVALILEDHATNKEPVVEIIYSHTQLKGKNKLILALLKRVGQEGMHLVAPISENLRVIGNMFHTDEVSEQCRRLLLENNRTKYRKFLNKVIWDIKKVSLSDRDNESVLPVEEAVAELKKLFVKMKADGVTPKQLLETSVWVHKVLHEFFFTPELDDYAIRAYIERHFAVNDVKQSKIGGEQPATVYDFCVDNDNLVHYMISPTEKSNQYLSIVKFRVNAENFSEAVTHENLLNSLASKYSESGIKSNGLRSHLRITLLVSVILEPTSAAPAFQHQSRNAQLEELPRHTSKDNELVASAEDAAEMIRNALSTKLTSVDISAHVIVCHEQKPLMQVDLLGAESLELWRLPEGAKLESDRMSNVNVFKLDDEKKRFSRLFVRENVELPIRPNDKWETAIPAEIASYIDNACGAINVTERRFKKMFFVANHVLMYVSFPKMQTEFTRDNTDELVEMFTECITEQRSILYKHHVTEVEVIFAKVDSDGKQLVKHRVTFRDETGVTPEFGTYEENKKQIRPLTGSHQLYGKTLEAHGKIKKIEQKRVSTRANGTTYVYDYPSLFGRACLEEWKKLFNEEKDKDEELPLFKSMYYQLTPEQQVAFHSSDYRQFFSEKELVLKDGALVHVSDKDELKRRADNCNNETGVVAWELRMFTPEKPEGYDVVVIANDITFQSGSFATQEDEIYQLASEYSRKNKIPRVNVSCNSGARIGLADDVSKTFRIKFKNPENPIEGYDYLYVDGESESTIGDQICYEKLPNGTLKLKSVIGRQNEQIGVENLQGSGLIAGETSAAYNEVPTYCYVTGRSVGIGAYTARLAHRIVQAKTSHLILTGAPALNTLLGKEVYTSNNQLGGIQIMHKNGVTHSVVNDDFEGICKIVQWMGYLPKQKKEFPFHEKYGMDQSPRLVNFDIETNKAYDVRDLIDSKDSTIHHGICDSNSFDEIMEEWAKTIVAGRARIGGMPIGIVSSELRNVKNVTPADPAAPNSQAIEIHQAGQVWYPDSAFKTAEVIGDFNREGLPLLFIASLRGFSGGQKDMFDMVLKFGAQIVDALREYKQPVIIYIPAQGELRGGAWAVLDSKINPGIITMVADEESRGGILEPNAIVGIKFRKDKMVALLKRNDELMQRWDKELSEEIRNNGPDSEEAQRLTKLSLKRADELIPAYRSASVEYADLHDRAERMHKKGAVQHVTDLTNSRNLFIQILSLETSKLHLAEKYMRVVRNVTRNEAYKWVQDQLDLFKSGTTSLSPKDQTTVLLKFWESGQFTRNLNAIHEESLERELSAIPEEVRASLLQRLLNRKGSI